jgi:polyisoprenoid-binding protein YceI
MTPRRSSVRLLAGLALAASAMHAAGQQAPEAAAGTSPGLTAGASYAIDPTHTFVVYEIAHYATSTNRGRFRARDGLVRIAADGASARIEITMDIATVDTGVDLLDRHLLSKDFLDVANWPVARFVAECAPVAGGKLTTAVGILELHGATRPVTLVARRFNCYISPMVGRQVCGGDFETTIRRSEFDITWGIRFGFEDEVRLLIQVEAIVAAPPR